MASSGPRTVTVAYYLLHNGLFFSLLPIPTKSPLLLPAYLPPTLSLLPSLLPSSLLPSALLPPVLI